MPSHQDKNNKRKHIEDEVPKPTIKIKNQEVIEAIKIIEQEAKVKNKNSRIKRGNIQD